MKRNYFGAILSLFTLAFILFGATLAANAQAQFRKVTDFDGDGKADITALRGDGGSGYQWFTQNSSNNALNSRVWGNGSGADQMTTGDYDGDGKADYADVRINFGGGNLTWYIRRSQTNTLYAVTFGSYNQTANLRDSPIPADYDGDGKTDIAVVRRTFNGQAVTSLTWYYLSSLTGQVGGSGTVQVVGGSADNICYATNGDFNGDGRADFVHICRNNATNSPVKYDIVLSSSGVRYQTQWGLAGDEPANGDYDGDGKTDFGTARLVPVPGSTTGDQYLVWYVFLSSSQTVLTKQFGGSFNNGAVVDNVTAADYDGDGKTDIAVLRTPGEQFHQPVTYYILQSSNNQVRAVNWGFSDDLSILRTYLNPANINAAS